MNDVEGVPYKGRGQKTRAMIKYHLYQTVQHHQKLRCSGANPAQPVSLPKTYERDLLSASASLALSGRPSPGDATADLLARVLNFRPIDVANIIGRIRGPFNLQLAWAVPQAGRVLGEGYYYQRGGFFSSRAHPDREGDVVYPPSPFLAVCYRGRICDGRGPRPHSIPDCFLVPPSIRRAARALGCRGDRPLTL